MINADNSQQLKQSLPQDSRVPLLTWWRKGTGRNRSSNNSFQARKLFTSPVHVPLCLPRISKRGRRLGAELNSSLFEAGQYELSLFEKVGISHIEYEHRDISQFDHRKKPGCRVVSGAIERKCPRAGFEHLQTASSREEGPRVVKGKSANFRICLLSELGKKRGLSADSENRRKQLSQFPSFST